MQEAQQYCSRLAHSHYENFSVVTWFLPKHLHQHFYNVYAYCRISDDLGDEVGDPQQSLALLDRMGSGAGAVLSEPESRGIRCLLRSAADACASCETFRSTRVFAICSRPFARTRRLLRYPTFADVLGYCQYSANPVGHLVLYVCGYRDAERQKLSDYTCTALQLANFWQDVAVDYGKGRIYLPLEDLAKYGVSEDDIAQRRATPAFLEMMKFEVARAREWFQMGSAAGQDGG